MQSLKSPYILYNQQSVGSTLHNNLLFITDTALEIYNADNFHFLHLLLFFFFWLPGSLGCRSLRGSVSSPARSGK